MQIPKPVSTMLKQGLGAVDYKNEVGAWKPAFLDIGWPELSKFLELSSFTEDEKKDLKEHRRRKKNRSYAKTSRAKKKTDGGPAGTGVYSSGTERGYTAPPPYATPPLIQSGSSAVSSSPSSVDAISSSPAASGAEQSKPSLEGNTEVGGTPRRGSGDPMFIN